MATKTTGCSLLNRQAVSVFLTGKPQNLRSLERKTKAVQDFLELEQIVKKWIDEKANR